MSPLTQRSFSLVWWISGSELERVAGVDRQHLRRCRAELLDVLLGSAAQRRRRAVVHRDRHLRLDQVQRRDIETPKREVISVSCQGSSGSKPPSRRSVAVSGPQSKAMKRAASVGSFEVLLTPALYVVERP